MSEKMRAAVMANLALARAVPAEIRLRDTRARRRARRRNLERAWAQQRDPRTLPVGNFIHGACSHDLRRTAPLCGESEGELNHWIERLFSVLPIVGWAPDRWLTCQMANWRVGALKVAERVWRVRRVLQSRVHRERLTFYEALFDAAAMPGGVGLERVARLAQGLGAALSLGRWGWVQRLTRGLEARQRSLRGILRRWQKAVPFWGDPLPPRWRHRGKTSRLHRGRGRRATPVTPLPAPPSGPPSDAGPSGPEASDASDASDATAEGEENPPSRPGASDATVEAEADSPPAAASPSTSSGGRPAGRPAGRRDDDDRWADWLRRRFAVHHWKLPSPIHDDPDGYDLHRRLVRAAVVGGDNLRLALGPRLEAAIESLARATWRRLGILRFALEIAIDSNEEELQAIQERAERQASEPDELAREEARLVDWIQADVRGYRAGLTMESLAVTWLNIDTEKLAEKIERQDLNVQSDMLEVVSAILDAFPPLPPQPARPAPEEVQSEAA